MFVKKNMLTFAKVVARSSMSDSDPKPAPWNQHASVKHLQPFVTTCIINKMLAFIRESMLPLLYQTSDTHHHPHVQEQERSLHHRQDPQSISSRFWPKNSYCDASKSILFLSADTKVRVKFCPHDHKNQDFQFKG